MIPGKSLNGKGEGASFPLRRIVLWTVAIVIAVPSALLLVLHLPFVQKIVIQRVARAVESRTSLRVEIESYRWWPSSRLHLHNLTIRGLNQEILKCEKAEIAYYISLKGGDLHPEEIYLEKPLIHLEKDVRGRWHVPHVARPLQRNGTSGDSTETFGWLGASRFQVRVASGTVLGRQDGQSVLNIRGISGAFSLFVETSESGPRIRVDLGELRSSMGITSCCFVMKRMGDSSWVDIYHVGFATTLAQRCART